MEKTRLDRILIVLGICMIVALFLLIVAQEHNRQIAAGNRRADAAIARAEDYLYGRGR